MKPRPLFYRALDFSLIELARFGGDPSKLPMPLQTLILVHSAQGIIDNGGLQYFFESDFEGQPPYSLFVEAYRRIGAERAASAIARAVGMFPFEEVHLDCCKRCAFLESLRQDESSEFAELDAYLCGNEFVWGQLERFVEANRLALGCDERGSEFTG